MTDKQNNEHLRVSRSRELKRTKVVIAYGVFVLSVAVFEVPLQRLILNTSKPISFTRRHTLWALLFAKSLLSNRCRLCSANFDRIQLLVSKYPWIRLHSEPPSLRMEFPDESSNVSSLGRPATADITRPPTVIKMTAFFDLYRSRESGELLRFKGCAKSQYMGFAVKMFECIGSE